MKIKKINIKNLISLMIVCFCTILLCGCASVDYSRFVYPTGEITDKIVIELDSKKISAAGFSVSSVASAIKNDLENFYVFPVRTFITNYLQNPNYTLEQKQIVNEGIKSNAEIIDGNKIFAEINFSSTALFNLYYGVETDEESENSGVEFREGAFTNKYVQSSVNAYAVLKSDSLKQILKKYEVYFNNKFSINDVKLTQVYASPDTQIKSNADVVETTKGIKMHQWEIDPNNLDFNLEFYRVGIRTGTWYILALFISLFVAFIIYCNIRSRQYKNKKNELENINQSGLKK